MALVRQLLAMALITLTLPLATPDQPGNSSNSRVLRGRLISINEGNDSKPLKNVLITIPQCGNTAITDDTGSFDVYLPRNSLPAGVEVDLVADNQKE